MVIVHLDNSFPRRTLGTFNCAILLYNQAGYYFNEISLREEPEYIILIMIQRSADISVFGTGRVNGLKPRISNQYIIYCKQTDVLMAITQEHLEVRYDHSQPDVRGSSCRSCGTPAAKSMSTKDHKRIVNIYMA